MTSSTTLENFGITVIPAEKVDDLPEMEVKFLNDFPTSREAIDFAHAEYQKDKVPTVILNNGDGKFSVWKGDIAHAG